MCYHSSTDDVKNCSKCSKMQYDCSKNCSTIAVTGSHKRQAGFFIVWNPEIMKGIRGAGRQRVFFGLPAGVIRKAATLTWKACGDSMRRG